MFQLDSDFWSWFNVFSYVKNSALLKLVVSCIDLLDSNLNLFSKNSGFKYVVSCNCIQIWNCFLGILIWDMLFPALFYLVMKVWIRIIFEILYFSLVLSLRCYLLMDIGVLYTVGKLSKQGIQWYTMLNDQRLTKKVDILVNEKLEYVEGLLSWYCVLGNLKCCLPSGVPIHF